MKALRNLFELITSIPFFGIIVNIFSGGFGPIVPIAFVLQAALQITCACLWLELPLAGTVAVAGALCCAHLFVGFLIALQPLSGMGPKPTYNDELGLVKLATAISLLFGGFCTAVVVALACLFSDSGILAFGQTLLLSTLGAWLVHLGGVVYPLIRASRR
ncbi:MAG: hypothetical protein K2X27_21410 [Candidatus Obscuribacterales bacterium]|nr:hypothetical protein [Candidatus Obscuribacterales bacterium]